MPKIQQIDTAAIFTKAAGHPPQPDTRTTIVSSFGAENSMRARGLKK